MIGMTYAAASGGGPTGAIAGWVTDLMDRLGAPGAGLLIALENLFPPLPSEMILPLAGFTAAQGGMSLAAASSSWPWWRSSLCASSGRGAMDASGHGRTRPHVENTSVTAPPDEARSRPVRNCSS